MKTDITSSDLSTRAMLSSVKITVWNARRLDRKVTAEATKANEATDDAGRFNKLLVPLSALAGVNSAQSEARNEHYRRTLPWKDEGPRILTSAAYVQYAEAMRKLKLAFEAQVEIFCDTYPNYLASAPTRLGKMFVESEFPGVDEIRDAFSFDVDISPLPTAGDFRVELSAVEASAIKADIQASIEAKSAAAANNAIADIGARINAVVGRMADRLNNYVPGTDGVRATNTFKDSLVENVRDLVEILPSLNVMGDPALTALFAKIEKDLCYTSPDTLRGNDVQRAKVAKSADEVLDLVKGYFG